MSISPLQAFSSLSSQYSIMQSRLQQMQAAQKGALDVRTISTNTLEAAGTQAALSSIPLQLFGLPTASQTNTARLPQDPAQIALKDARSQRTQQTEGREKTEQQNLSDEFTRFESFLQQRQPQNLQSSLAPQLSLDSQSFLQIFSQSLGQTAPVVSSTAPRNNGEGLLARQLGRASDALQRSFAVADENSIDIAA